MREIGCPRCGNRIKTDAAGRFPFTTLFLCLVLTGCGNEEMPSGSASNPTKVAAEGENGWSKLGTTWARIDRVEVGPIKYRALMLDHPLKTKKSYLQVWLTIHNDSQTKTVSYWRRGPILKDESENQYRHVFVYEKIEGADEEGSGLGELYPGTDFRDVLCFELPVDKRKTLTLLLPSLSGSEEGNYSFVVRPRGSNEH